VYRREQWAAEPNSLMVRIDFDQRDAMIEEAPETYYIRDHYARTRRSLSAFLRSQRPNFAIS
jgi:hypothetical protein